MLKHVKKYAKCPLTVKPFDELDYEGNKTYKDDINITCSIVGKIEVVKNKFGEDTVSNKHLYVDASLLQSVSDNDLMIFENTTHDVISIESHYRKGVLDMYTIYC